MHVSTCNTESETISTIIIPIESIVIGDSFAFIKGRGHVCYKMWILNKAQELETIFPASVKFRKSTVVSPLRALWRTNIKRQS